MGQSFSNQVCFYRSKLLRGKCRTQFINETPGIQLWRWKLLKMFHLLCTDFVKYNFVLDWHVHWYVCTAVWYVSFIIVSWYWYVTVFGFYLSCFVTDPAPRTSPKHYLSVTLTFRQKKRGVCCDMKNLYWRLVLFISLHESFFCSIRGSNHAPDIFFCF